MFSHTSIAEVETELERKVRTLQTNRDREYLFDEKNTRSVNFLEDEFLNYW